MYATLITIFREQLVPQLAPQYSARLQTNVVNEYLVSDSNSDRTGLMPPAPASSAPVVTAEPLVVTPLRLRLPHRVERRLTEIRILHQPNQKLVAVIELLSPVNKRPGDKRQEYLAKRQRYIEAQVHLVEIDLLRRWPRMPLAEEPPTCDYLILVSNAFEWPEASVWALTVRHPLPIIPIPLLRGDPPVLLDLGDALRTAYDRARYDLRIDYRQPPQPLLAAEDGEWARAVVGQAAEA